MKAESLVCLPNQGKFIDFIKHCRFYQNTQQQLLIDPWKMLAFSFDSFQQVFALDPQLSDFVLSETTRDQLSSSILLKYTGIKISQYILKTTCVPLTFRIENAKTKIFVIHWMDVERTECNTHSGTLLWFCFEELDLEMSAVLVLQENAVLVLQEKEIFTDK